MFASNRGILCQRLKEKCFLNGTEKDPLQSAVTLRAVANNFMESTRSEMGMIKSALLLKGAELRSPDLTLEIDQDFRLLWQTILELSNAKDRGTSLQVLTSQLREEVKAMRKNTTDRLNIFRKQNKKVIRERSEMLVKEATINGNQNLKARTTEEFTRVIKNLYDKCIKIMGTPPCKFSIVGMGSIAQKEVTPYSEFYHAIVLENKVQNSKNFLRTSKYFSWLSVLFHVVVINLGETPVSTVPIEGLEWFSDHLTNPGFSSCGIFHRETLYPHRTIEYGPLKTSDYVKTRDDMLAPLKMMNGPPHSHETSWIKLMRKTCFITGNDSLHKSLSSKFRALEKSRRRNDFSYNKLVQNEIQYDKKNLNVIENLSFLHSSKPLDYKQVVYNSITALVAFLGSMYDLTKTSSHEIVQKLAKKRVLDHDESQALSYAIAVSSQCRLSISMEKERRAEYTVHGQMYREIISEFEHAVGVSSLVELFAVAVRLEQAITKYEKSAPPKTLKLHIPSHSRLKAIILCALHLNSSCLSLCQKQQRNYTSSSSEARFFRFLQAVSNCNLNRPIEALKFFRMTLRVLGEHGKEKITCFYYMGLCHIKKNEPKLAISYLKSGYRMQLEESIEEGSDIGLARFLFQLGFCSKKLGQIEEALEYFRSGLEIRRSHPDFFQDDLKSNWLNEIGLCYYHLEEGESSIAFFQESVNACKQESRDERSDKRLANLLFNLGSCLCEMQRFDEALVYFEEELLIRQKLDRTTIDDLNESQEAIERCKRALEITTIF